MARKPRIKSSTGIYHVLVRAIADLDLVSDKEDTDIYTGILRDLQDKGICTVYAYALFPTHAHLLIKAATESSAPVLAASPSGSSAPVPDAALVPDVSPSGFESIGSIMKRIASAYSYYFNVKYDHYGPIYIDRFKSEPIEDRTTFLRCLAFVADQNTPHKGILTHTIPLKDSPAPVSDASPSVSAAPVPEVSPSASAAPSRRFLDYTSRPKRITDSRLLLFLQNEHHFTTSEEFLQRPDSDKTHVIVSSRPLGATVLQLARLTGLTRKVVTRMASNG